MMTLANYGIGSSKQSSLNSAKSLSKSLQIRNRAELLLKQSFKSQLKSAEDKRAEILNLISCYYSRVPFNALIWNKYQTKQCIIDSILLLDSRFDPYKAREAFRQVERMLSNLVFVPWHKEFQRIYTYSGAFRLTVSDPLIGIEEVFKVAGFTESQQDPLHLLLADDKMPQLDDGEAVKSVIFDCMVAQEIMTNIIDVFENCCKASKRSDELISEINCYSWIQAFFRERCHQTSELACSNIQELLNSITLHLSRIETSVFNEKSSDLDRTQQLADRSELTRFDKQIPSSIGDTMNRAISTQERTREFLASQDDDNLLALPRDLLRMPASCSTSNSIGNSGLDQQFNRNHPTHVSDKQAMINDTCQTRSAIRPLYAFNAEHSSTTTNNNTSSTQGNGYTNSTTIRQQYNKLPTSSSSSLSYASASRRAHDVYDGSDYLIHIDSTPSSRLGGAGGPDSINSRHCMIMDPPHNDLEHLIPKYDRNRYHHSQSSAPSNTTNRLTLANSLAASQPLLRHKPSNNTSLPDSDHHHTLTGSTRAPHQGAVTSKSHTSYNLSSAPRHHHQFDDHDLSLNYNAKPSHMQTSYSSHHSIPSKNTNHHHTNNNNLQSSKYSNSSPSKKYESRDLHNALKSSNSHRGYWSCGSCTYNNQIDSEMCEMCRNRRPSH